MRTDSVKKERPNAIEDHQKVRNYLNNNNNTLQSVIQIQQNSTYIHH
ncbi:hypothetical protein HanPSC8_Chr17g0781371 [Helianthus annuus]|nr:hypothetical protein HanPSC8_Chr17g0781371 [Helianthus annuus]